MPYYQEGLYKATITHLGLGKSSKKGTDYVQVVVQPTAMIDVEKDAIYPVDKTYEREIALWLTEATAQRAFEDLRRIGFTSDSVEDLVDGPIHDAIVGTEVEVYCELEPSPDGKTFERWRFRGSVQPVMKATKPEKAELLKLNALWGKQLKASKLQAANTPQAGKPKANVRPSPAPPADANAELAAVEDDSIPF